jgi:phage/plasmid-like protein (TIGR03299 family)
MSRLTGPIPAAKAATVLASNRALPWMDHSGTGTDRHDFPEGGCHSVAHALEAGALTWEVGKRNLRTMDGTLVPDFQAVVRTDTKAVLGVVGRKYVPLQNAQALEPVDALLGESGGTIQAVGALNGGRRVFVAIQLPGDFQVPGDPTTITPWMIVANGHDGSLALSVNVMESVLRCTNVLVALSRSAAYRIRLIHRPGIEVRYQEAHAVIARANDYLAESHQVAADLAARRITEGQARAIIGAAFPVHQAKDTSAEDGGRKAKPTMFDGAWANYQVSDTIPDSLRMTAWGAIQAVTEWVDHGTAFRGGTTQGAADRRANALMFGGRADNQKAAAVDAALALPRRRAMRPVVVGR